MKGVVIIGAGGHGREVAEILRHQAEAEDELDILGFVDDDPRLRGQRVDGLPILGDWSWLEEADRDSLAVICAAGYPPMCRRLTQRADQLGLPFISAISPLARVSPLAQVGQGVIVFPNVIVNTCAQLGDHCTLNVGVTVSHDAKVGRYANVNPGAHLAGNVSVGEGCYIGMGANVIQGCSIGPWAVVGAGAGVIRDLPPNVTAVGVPARVIKIREEGWYER